MDLLTWMQEQPLEWTEEQRQTLMQAQEELDTLRAQLDAMQQENLKNQEEEALSEAIEAEFKERSITRGAVIRALLDRSKISLEDGEIVGLREQLDAMSADETTAFLFEPERELPRFVPVGRKSLSHREKAARRIMGLA